MPIDRPHLHVVENFNACERDAELDGLHHGVDGAGKDVVNDGKGMHVHAPNISPGPGNVVANYSVTDWVRTLRHGVKPDGRPAVVMPSEDYNRFTDADLTALVARRVTHFIERGWRGDPQ